VGLSKANRMSPIRTTPRALVMLTASFLAVGLWQIGEGSWIYAKARLAQFLLQRAWSRALTGEPAVKPWPWADTWPVARLRVRSMGIDLIVLNGAYGRTLAFGPAYVESSAVPGSIGTTILTGHRDTHFAFLKRLKQDDEIVLEPAAGRTQRYLVRDSQIVDAHTALIGLSDGGDQLVLVTCYPFDRIVPGGPLRYVVSADRLISADPRSTDRPAGREWAARRE
jgi:sortase A